jgi:hypothetical protein
MVCASKGLTMSSVLNSLIDQWIIDQAENLKHRSTSLQRVDEAIASSQVKHLHLHQTDHDDGPISFFHHDGSDFNEHNF